MAEPWYDYPDGHGYITSYEGPNTDTPHYAEDIETPFHTPITAILPGTVKVADYQGWGGEIFIQPDDTRYPEYYFYHPDEVDVHVGQHVSAGQQIALSGGENPGYPGAEHPASPEWSSGPHTHVGWFTKWQSTPIGTRPYGPDPSNLIEMAKGGGAVASNVPANVYSAVEPYAQQYGVPDAVWETIAEVESGFNTSAVGDNGTSFGIFQLHEGGQFPSAYLNNPTALDDPGLNAKYAMPAIGSAWKNLSATFNAGSSSWWEEFAAQSGHPGGSPGETVTDNEAAKLQSTYGQYANGTSTDAYTGASTCTAPTGVSVVNPGAWAAYWACQAQQGASNAAGNVEAGIASWVGATIGPLLLRVGVGIVGLALIWIGANEISTALRGEGGSTQVTQGEAPAKSEAEKKDKKEEKPEQKQSEKKAEKKEAKSEKKRPEPAQEVSEGAGETGAGAGASAGGEAAGGADTAELAALA